MNVRGRFAHPVTVARRATRRRVDGEDEAGFTLIELVIVVIILPIVLGGIAVALLSVFGLQDQTQNRIGDSNDEQVSSSTFNKDVQSAQEIETDDHPSLRNERANPTRRTGVGARLQRELPDRRFLRGRPEQQARTTSSARFAVPRPHLPQAPRRAPAWSRTTPDLPVQPPPATPVRRR